MKDEDPKGPVVITGGAGFIGTNLANRLASMGENVVLVDNLARPGVERNVRFLSGAHGSRIRLFELDCRDSSAMAPLVSKASSVFHLAAQVAVTRSIENPIEDFDVNARGTLELLELVRRGSRPVPFIFTSTNKVYGSLEDVSMKRVGLRMYPRDEEIERCGIDESRSVEFHSPYGCSKGTADQYALDYARTFGLRAVVFRMSCIYGPHQFGTEDQGWVAHFLLRAIADEPITIYGDGLQVRDLLFVEDLVDAFLLARKQAAALAGRAYNIGGGPGNTSSLLELLSEIALLTGRHPRLRFEVPRLADQRYYVSNVQRFSRETGWRPTTGIRRGLARLFEWARASVSVSRGIDANLSSAEDLALPVDGGP